MWTADAELSLIEVLVGRIGKPHGVRGEVDVEIGLRQPEHRAQVFLAPGIQRLVLANAFHRAVQFDQGKPIADLSEHAFEHAVAGEAHLDHLAPEKRFEVSPVRRDP